MFMEKGTNLSASTLPSIPHKAVPFIITNCKSIIYLKSNPPLERRGSIKSPL
jgi:hypothetical protein